MYDNAGALLIKLEGQGVGLPLNQTRHGRDTELCFDQSFKCCSSILSNSAGVKCAVVQVKGVDAPFAAAHSAPDGSFSGWFQALSTRTRGIFC